MQERIRFRPETALAEKPNRLFVRCAAPPVAVDLENVIAAVTIRLGFPLRCLRLAAAFEQYTNARFQADKYSKDILPNAQASLKLTTSGYQQGEFSYLSLLTAQRTAVGTVCVALREALEWHA